TPTAARRHQRHPQASDRCDKIPPETPFLTPTKQTAGSYRSGRVKRYTFRYTGHGRETSSRTSFEGFLNPTAFAITSPGAPWTATAEVARPALIWRLKGLRPFGCLSDRLFQRPTDPFSYSRYASIQQPYRPSTPDADCISAEPEGEIAEEIH